MKGRSRGNMERKLDVGKETMRKIGGTVCTDESTRAVLVNEAERCREVQGEEKGKSSNEAVF